jgi:hypothetical protein
VSAETVRRTSPVVAGEPRTAECRGLVRGTEMPLTGAIRAEIVALFAAAGGRFYWRF